MCFTVILQDTLTNAVESFQVPVGSIAFFIMIILEIRERHCSYDAMQWPKVEDANKIERCIFSYGHLMHQADPKDSLQLLVQFISESAISKDMQSSQCTPLSQFHTVVGQVPNHIKSHVFIAIGKLCLVNAQAVKLCVPALVQQLQTSSDYRVRNNIVIMLCDLTVRYTLIVDPYMNCITSCLQDEHPLIRKQTFIMLTKLLQLNFDVHFASRLESTST
ncbi:hypothetical protein HELRODRAFT_164902 [Helobdella robusta]|uniref:Condensin complex subunit 1 C-terminal domain-containing protein n=1 Tax=Helobdella robusta TaxID=6412 RepID=T1EVY1_HELRO|nr:hypothetical protein HELRODRAFT_164902 [Helobdella robusta]ESN92787.1 hypothetical protein HELRODRAFT_164902 [Helobdella robusta]